MPANVRPHLLLLAPLLALCLLGAPSTAGAHTVQTASAAAPAAGVPLSPEQLSAMLPATVYFQGRSATIQLRNSGGVIFANGAPVWVALVDSSGYSTSVQERYQFYLVTEGPLRVGDASLAAGAYGGGFLGDHFLLMDIGGHTIAQGPAQLDKALTRPRPLAILPDSGNSVKLYLGRHWVLLQAGPGTSAH